MKEKLNILLLGSGGREASIARSLEKSPRCAKLILAPGNACGYGRNAAIDPCDFDAVERLAEEEEIDLIVVGPEAPLVKGIADHFEEKNYKVIGCSKAGAELEGSKEFAKEFMYRHAIPTARFMSVTTDTLDEGVSFLESMNPPYVLKADGLAAGKGVLIIDNLAEARKALEEMVNGMFGDASKTVVIEQFLQGIECSVFIATDGEDYRLLPVAKDYKRVGEGDTGLNTGGMGAVSPVPFADEEFMEKVERRIIEPTVRGLREEEIDYRGFIFFGLMNVEGDPYVIEYNVRLGDPETEVVLPRLESDLVDLMEGIADRTLGLKKVKISDDAAVTVMLVSGGYPGSYEKGKEITGIEKLPTNVIPFVAGATRDEQGRLLTQGGRVIALTAMAPSLEEAAATAQKAAADVDFEGKHYRRDIAQDILKG